MPDAVLYIHGRGGSAREAEHYEPLFPDREVLGLEYRGDTAEAVGPEVRAAVEALAAEGRRVALIANSIGAWYALNAGVDGLVEKAYFISPIVDMERLILDMLRWAGHNEAELQARGVLSTPFGEDLSWDYLAYVRAHPVGWSVPTAILYGHRDNLTARETVAAFARRHRAALTIMEGGEHWFHTAAQMTFLDDWIERSEEHDRDPQ